MTKYREIIQLAQPDLKLSQQKIAFSRGVSKKTVNKVFKSASEKNISWPLPASYTDAFLEGLLFPGKREQVDASKRCMPNYEYVRKELLKNGVNKKLLWTEYLEECRLSGENPLTCSQFFYYILQQDEQKRRATMHISRKPREQIEVDWAGDSEAIIDPDTGEITSAFIFVGVLTYSQYPYVEAFLDEKQGSWITARPPSYTTKTGMISGLMLCIKRWPSIIIRQSSRQGFVHPRINPMLRTLWATYPHG